MNGRDTGHNVSLGLGDDFEVEAFLIYSRARELCLSLIEPTIIGGEFKILPNLIEVRLWKALDLFVSILTCFGARM